MKKVKSTSDELRAEYKRSDFKKPVATVRVFLTVGFSLDDEPTVNSNCELTVATSPNRYPRVAPRSRLAGPLRSQDRPWIGRGDPSADGRSRPSADGLRVFVGRPDASGRHPRSPAEPKQ